MHREDARKCRNTFSYCLPKATRLAGILACVALASGSKTIKTRMIAWVESLDSAERMVVDPGACQGFSMKGGSRKTMDGDQLRGGLIS